MRAFDYRLVVVIWLLVAVIAWLSFELRHALRRARHWQRLALEQKLGPGVELAAGEVVEFVQHGPSTDEPQAMLDAHRAAVVAELRA